MSSLHAIGGGSSSGGGGGAGLGGGANTPPNNAGGTVTVVGTMASGSSTSGGNGASSSSGGLAPGLGSTLTFDGNPAYLITTSSSNGAAGTGAGGNFTMSCALKPALTLAPGFVVGSVAANAPVTLSGSNLQANSPWTATIRSTPVVFANGITNGSGSFSQAANLPASILPGAHIITLLGTNPSGGQMSQVLYITVDATGHISYLSTSGPQSNTGSQPGSGGSSLAETGFNAALGVNAVIVLIAAGGVLLLLARRRNIQH